MSNDEKKSMKVKAVIVIEKVKFVLFALTKSVSIEKINKEYLI